MTRLACLRVTVVSAALIAVAAARPAQASDPVGVYVAASRVDTMPNDASATSVAIHGAFITLRADGSYTAPQCGVMYYQCPAGSETMCRMQWQDVRTIGTAATTCAGFGTLNVITSAAIRAEGTPLTAPDTWDLGLGVATGVYVGGQCAPAKASVCPPGPSTGGTGGTTGTGGAGGTTGSAGSVGTTGGAGSVGTTGAGTAGTTGAGGIAGGGPAGSGGVDGTGTGGKGGGEVLSKRSSGCEVAGGRGSAAALPIVTLLFAAVLFRRRRR